MKKITLIVPAYNEEGVIDLFLEKINEILIQVSEKYNVTTEILFVNDGSKDKTWDEIILAKSRYKNIHAINLSRNFGKEAALTAGLDYTDTDAAIPIDVDLQDDPTLIFEMIEIWQKGADTVIAVRRHRDDSPIKKFTSEKFYSIFNKFSIVKIPYNAGDFRLIDRKVIDALKTLRETNRFMKGLFAWVGFKSIHIDFTRQKRVAGSTKWNYWKLWNFALDGITGFTTLPLRIWTYIGAVVALFSFVYGMIILLKTFVVGPDLNGYPSIMVTILFLGGVQLIGMGILGEYLGRLYLESKCRPVYIIREVI